MRGEKREEKLSARSDHKRLRLRCPMTYNHLVDFTVFLSYSAAPEEQALVWRLQTLATAEGISVFVPPRTDSRLAAGKSSPVPAGSVRRQIDLCDCVLAILANGLTTDVQKELSYALGKNKVIIPIVDEGIGHARFMEKFPVVFQFSPSCNVGEIETQVVAYLKGQMRNKAQRQALGALVGIGLGLFLLSAAAKE